MFTKTKIRANIKQRCTTVTAALAGVTLKTMPVLLAVPLRTPVGFMTYGADTN